MESFESESQIDDDEAGGGNNEDLDDFGFDDNEKDDDDNDWCNRWRFSQHVGPKLSAPLLFPETNDEDLLDISKMVRVTTMVVLVMILSLMTLEMICFSELRNSTFMQNPFWDAKTFVYDINPILLL